MQVVTSLFMVTMVALLGSGHSIGHVRSRRQLPAPPPSPPGREQQQPAGPPGQPFQLANPIYGAHAPALPAPYGRPPYPARQQQQQQQQQSRPPPPPQYGRPTAVPRGPSPPPSNVHPKSPPVGQTVTKITFTTAPAPQAYVRIPLAVLRAANATKFGVKLEGSSDDSTAISSDTPASSDAPASSDTPAKSTLTIQQQPHVQSPGSKRKEPSSSYSSSSSVRIAASEDVSASSSPALAPNSSSASGLSDGGERAAEAESSDPLAASSSTDSATAAATYSATNVQAPSNGTSNNANSAAGVVVPNPGNVPSSSSAYPAAPVFPPHPVSIQHHPILLLLPSYGLPAEAFTPTQQAAVPGPLVPSAANAYHSTQPSSGSSVAASAPGSISYSSGTSPAYYYYSGPAPGRAPVYPAAPRPSPTTRAPAILSPVHVPASHVQVRPVYSPPTSPAAAGITYSEPVPAAPEHFPTPDTPTSSAPAAAPTSYEPNPDDRLSVPSNAIAPAAPTNSSPTPRSPSHNLYSGGDDQQRAVHDTGSALYDQAPSASQDSSRGVSYETTNSPPPLPTSPQRGLSSASKEDFRPSEVDPYYTRSSEPAAAASLPNKPAFVMGSPQSTNHGNHQTVRFTQTMSGRGYDRTEYETSHGIHSYEETDMNSIPYKKLQTRSLDLTNKGSFGWAAPDGRRYQVRYVADALT